MTLDETTVTCPRCGTGIRADRLFCDCGKLLDRDGLRKVRLAGLVGVGVNPKFDAFWASGDPADLP